MDNIKQIENCKHLFLKEKVIISFLPFFKFIALLFGDLFFLFTILFFYNIKKENDIVKAYDLSKSFYKEDFSKITKEEFKDEHRSKKKNC